MLALNLKPFLVLIVKSLAISPTLFYFIFLSIVYSVEGWTLFTGFGS